MCEGEYPGGMSESEYPGECLRRIYRGMSEGEYPEELLKVNIQGV